MLLRLIWFFVSVICVTTFNCTSAFAVTNNFSFENLHIYKSTDVQNFPVLDTKDVLAVDAPSDDGRKLLLIWKYPFKEAKPKLNYVVAWSPDGIQWSPREQMIESPCDPDISMRIKDYWELNEPKMSVYNRFEHLGSKRDFFVLEFTDFDFIRTPSEEWFSIINAAKTGLKNKIKEDFHTCFNDYIKDMPISLISYETELDDFLKNIDLFKIIDNEPIWGDSDLPLLLDLDKVYKDTLNKAIDVVIPKIYGTSINTNELKLHLPKYKTPFDNALIWAVDDKYSALRLKQKNYRISSQPLTNDQKLEFIQLTELHLAVGVYSIDAPDEIRWLKTDLIAKPKTSIYSMTKLNVMIIALLISGIFFLNIYLARKNPNLTIRRINGLEAVDEAIGRATEMGRPILYHTGADSLEYMSTLAAVTILGKVALKVADYECDLLVPARDPIVLTVCQEVVREAYMNSGRIDAFKEENIFFLSDDQFAYTAAVNGIMMRDKPAANFMMGYYYAEALLLAETGASTGAIQIAGTDAMNQLPFFICTCDYTLIGEELYAASAYLSREPLQMGSLRGQDTIKLIIMTIILLGCLLPTIGLIATDWFNLQADQKGWYDILQIIFYPFM